MRKVRSFFSSVSDILTTFQGAWAFIFLCWLPAFLADWPGVFVIDNVFQMRWYLEGTVSAHHPVLHTYLLGAVMSLGKAVFGSWEAGLCVFSVLQMLFLSAVFAYTIRSLKEGTGRIFRTVAVLCYALIPYNPVSAFSATKDSIFAGLFLLAVLRTYLIVLHPEKFFPYWKKMAGYMILVFLMCAFRNTGIFIFLFTMPSFVIVCRKYWRKVIVIGLCCAAAWGIFTGPVYSVLGISKGSSAEILSVPMQQLSRVMVYSPEDLTEEQWEKAEAYMPFYDRYAPRVADPVKDGFNADLFDEAPGEFIKLWAEVGLKAPVVYIQAFFDMNVGFWNPFMEYPDPGTYLAYIPYHSADPGAVGASWEGQVFVENHSLLPLLDSFYEKMTETGGYNTVPGLKFVYSTATAFWLVVAAIIWCIKKRRWAMAVPFFLLIGLWGTLMLSPVVAFRYGYPLIISLPVVWAMCGKREEHAFLRHQVAEEAKV